MLAAGAAETDQRESSRIDAARQCDVADGVGHVFDRDIEITGGQLFRAVVEIQSGVEAGGLLRKGGAHDLAIERLIGMRSEYGGEEISLQAAEQQVGIGHRQRAAASVTGWAGQAAGGIRAGMQTLAIEMQDRATARRHGMHT